MGIRVESERPASPVTSQSNWTLRVPFPTMKIGSKERESPGREGLKTLRKAARDKGEIPEGWETPQYTQPHPCPWSLGRHPMYL